MSGDANIVKILEDIQRRLQDVDNRVAALQADNEAFKTGKAAIEELTASNESMVKTLMDLEWKIRARVAASNLDSTPRDFARRAAGRGMSGVGFVGRNQSSYLSDEDDY